MTEQEYLDAVIAKNPAIGRPDDQTVTLTARGLRALIRQSFQRGYFQGRENQRFLEEQAKKLSSKNNIFERFFK